MIPHVSGLPTQCWESVIQRPRLVDLDRGGYNFVALCIRIDIALHISICVELCISIDTVQYVSVCITQCIRIRNRAVYQHQRHAVHQHLHCAVRQHRLKNTARYLVEQTIEHTISWTRKLGSQQVHDVQGYERQAQEVDEY